MKYNKEILEVLVKECTNLSEMVRKLNNTERAHGSLVAYLKNKLVENNIDFSHFNGKTWCTGKNNPTGIAHTKEYFITNFLKKDGATISTSNLKKKLIKFGLKDNVCEKCGNNGEWNGESITLQIHHVDGNNKNNEISNLNILCPNCHSQTNTFTGKNNRKILAHMES